MRPLETEWQRKWIGLEKTHAEVQALAGATQAFCGNWVRNAPGGARLLVICGDTGTGKTTTARAIARYCRAAAMKAFELGHWGTHRVPAVSYLAWPEAANEFNNKNNSALADAIAAELLILDDVGAENDPFKIAVDKLCQILSRRDGAWTVVTTNVFPDNWPEIFDTRTADRLLRKSLVVELKNVESFATQH